MTRDVHVTLNPGLSRQNCALSLILQKNRELDQEICVVFATGGCPEQSRMVKKIHPKSNGYALKAFCT